VLTVGGALSFAFSSPNNPHFLIPIISILVSIFLISARTLFGRSILRDGNQFPSRARDWPRFHNSDNRASMIKKIDTRIEMIGSKNADCFGRAERE